MNKHIYYSTIFLYASHQFCGNIDTYFSTHAKKAIIFRVMPRVKNANNSVEVYEKGKLIKSKKINLSENIFFYYVKWYIEYIKILFLYTSPGERIVVISFHPLSFFLSSLQKLFRKITFVYWVGDYFFPTSYSLKLFEMVKKFFHDRISYTCYLGDMINEKMNGKILNTYKRKTIMWGVIKKFSARTRPRKIFRILFVGVIKGSQGLEKIFSVLGANKTFRLDIIGVCDKILFNKYTEEIKKLGIKDQIYFPNKFFSDSQLIELAKEANIGVALYDVTITNPAYYTDPGKVKSYIEMGLPVIMSNISAVAQYVKKYHAGEVINVDNESVEEVIKKIHKNYSFYQAGVSLFLKHFNFEHYYKEKFKFLETEEDCK